MYDCLTLHSACGVVTAITCIRAGGLLPSMTQRRLSLFGLDFNVCVEVVVLMVAVRLPAPSAEASFGLVLMTVEATDEVPVEHKDIEFHIALLLFDC